MGGNEALYHESSQNQWKKPIWYKNWMGNKLEDPIWWLLKATENPNIICEAKRIRFYEQFISSSWKFSTTFGFASIHGYWTNRSSLRNVCINGMVVFHHNRMFFRQSKGKKWCARSILFEVIPTKAHSFDFLRLFPFCCIRSRRCSKNFPVPRMFRLALVLLLLVMLIGNVITQRAFYRHLCSKFIFHPKGSWRRWNAKQ